MTTVVMDFSSGVVHVDTLVSTTLVQDGVDFHRRFDIKHYYKLFKILEGGIIVPYLADTPDRKTIGCLVGCGCLESLASLADNYGQFTKAKGKARAWAIYSKNGSYNVVHYNVVEKKENAHWWGSKKEDSKVWEVTHTSVHSDGLLCQGSGSDLAYNALIQGMSCEEAIVFTSQHDVSTGGEVVSLNLKQDN